ncbi:MAG: hypothetical protein BGP13_14260 [Sphingobacteriales bacterium 40-81]|nr:MAG: hypothetical protein BGP13_14260 [Sphingobacteriales bacterium 40-81]
MFKYKEEAEKIAKEIKKYTHFEPIEDFDKSTFNEHENIWGASFLYAEILYQSKEEKYFCVTYDCLSKIHDDYFKQTGNICDFDSLISKFWLRNIHNRIHIAGAIRIATKQFKEVRSFKKDFEFLTLLLEACSTKTISKTAFDEAKITFEKLNDIELQTENYIKLNWLKLNNDTIELLNIDLTNVLFENEHAFLFIDYLIQIMTSDNKLYIEKEVLEDIIKHHTKVFSRTPTIEAFIKDGIFIQQNDVCFIELVNRYEHFNGIILNKTGALLWQKILESPSFSSNADRLQYWYHRIVFEHNVWCSIEEFFTRPSKKIFLDSALDVLLQDSDLVKGINEFNKLVLDKGERIYRLESVMTSKAASIYFPLDNEDILFEQYSSLELLDQDTQGMLLFDQSCRNELRFYLFQLINNETASFCENIFRLLEEGHNKSYLLWETCINLIENRPDILPYLVTDKRTSALAFALTWRLRIRDDLFIGNNDIRFKFLESHFQLLCKTFNDANVINDQQKASIIFRCMKKAVIKQFQVIGGTNPLKLQEDKKLVSNLVTNLKAILVNIFGEKVEYYNGVITELLVLIKRYIAISNRKGKILSIPFIEIYLLTWIQELIQTTFYKSHSRQTIIYEILSVIQQKYLASINCKEVEVWDYEKEKFCPQIPIWSNQHINHRLIDWKMLFVHLESVGLLDDFVRPGGLTLNSTKEKYDSYNSFIVSKIRTHLSILILAYNEIYADKRTLNARNMPCESIIDKLEMQIKQYIEIYSVENMALARVDIFARSLEKTFWNKTEEQLLPVVADTINRFKGYNKKKIIASLVSNETLFRSLTLLEFLVSEGDRQQVFSLIDENSFEPLFSAKYNLDDTEFILERLAQEKQFLENVSTALQTWENKSVTIHQQDAVKIMCFRIRILLISEQLDENLIDTIPEPILQSKNFSPSFTKNFYKALIHFRKKDALKAYTLFDEQLKSPNVEKATVGINRFAAKLMWADQLSKADEKQIKYQEALNEWLVMEDQLLENEIDIKYIKSHIAYNKLYAHLELKNDTDFERIFDTVESFIQFRPEFLELRIKNLLNRRMENQADSLLLKAEDYHRSDNGELPEFILKLGELTENNLKSLDYLRDQHRRILTKSPESLIKILPESLSKDIELPRFLLREIVNSASDMLKHITSIHEIKKEDKYSDLIILILNSKFSYFSWQVTSDKGGYPASGNNNLGLIDFSIRSQKGTLAVCEALNVKGKNLTEIQSHNFKIFNYDPVKNTLFIIVYYLGKSDNFLADWDKYKLDVKQAITFPSGYEIVDDEIEDMSADFGNESVKCCKTQHGSNHTRLFHIFININYKVG